MFTTVGWVWVNPYMTLVAAYERMIGGRGVEIMPGQPEPPVPDKPAAILHPEPPPPAPKTAATPLPPVKPEPAPAEPVKAEEKVRPAKLAEKADEDGAPRARPHVEQHAEVHTEEHESNRVRMRHHRPQRNRHDD